jgi:hypothetical protein
MKLIFAIFVITAALSGCASALRNQATGDSANYSALIYSTLDEQAINLYRVSIAYEKCYVPGRARESYNEEAKCFAETPLPVATKSDATFEKSLLQLYQKYPQFKIYSVVNDIKQSQRKLIAFNDFYRIRNSQTSCEDKRKSISHSDLDNALLNFSSEMRYEDLLKLPEICIKLYGSWAYTKSGARRLGSADKFVREFCFDTQYWMYMTRERAISIINVCDLLAGGRLIPESEINTAFKGLKNG